MACLIIGFSPTEPNPLPRYCPAPQKGTDSKRSLLSELLRHGHLDMRRHGQPIEDSCSDDDDYTDYSDCGMDAGSLDDDAPLDSAATASRRSQMYRQGSGVYSTSQPIPIPYSRLRNKHMWERARWELAQQAQRQYMHEVLQQQQLQQHQHQHQQR